MHPRHPRIVVLCSFSIICIICALARPLKPGFFLPEACKSKRDDTGPLDPQQQARHVRHRQVGREQAW